MLFLHGPKEESPMRNMMLLTGLLACLVLSAGPALAADEVVQTGQNVVEVTVTGTGMTKDAALRDAQRKAIEQGAGTYISSHSQVKDFALIKDTIYAKAAGFIQKTEIISPAKEQEDGSWTIKIKAEVSIKGIDDTWGVVSELLKAMVRPKIMVVCSEKIDRALQEDSTVQTRIEKLLLDSGFSLVNQKQLKAIEVKDIQAAMAEDKPEKVQAIAKQYGAQIFITGSTTATAGERGAVSGVEIYRYGSDGDVKCYNSDDARMIASVNDRGFSADRVSRNAAKKAIELLGDKLAPQVQLKILENWQGIIEGRGEIRMEVEGIKFGQVDGLEEALKKVKEITQVSTEFHNGIADCTIEASGHAKDLAKIIAKAIKNLEITDVSQNVIKAKWNE